MTDESQADTAPAATADTAPDGNVSQQAADTQAPTPAGDTSQSAPPADGVATPEFSLPDEHKDKSWSSKVKSQEDVYKQLDNLSELVGKKTVQPIDYSTATPEEIAAHHASLAPEDASKYDFGENADPEFSAAVGNVFKEFGINEFQAKGIAEKIGEITAGMAQQQEADASDGDKYAEMLKETFGAEYKEVYQKLDNSIKKYSDEKDLALIRDGIPNTTKLALDRILYNVLQKHGALETGAQGEGEVGGANVGTDIEKVRADLRKQAREIDSRPHTAEEKRAINLKLAETYK